MGVRIQCKTKEVLDLKNTTLDSLHKKILEILQNKNINLSENLQNLIEQMDQDIWGLGVIHIDIADYILNKQDLILFTDLLKQAIEEENQEYPYAQSTAREIIVFL